MKGVILSYLTNHGGPIEKGSKMSEPKVSSSTTDPHYSIVKTGKVRNMYQIGSGVILAQATDRISARDYPIATLIPHKGIALTRISNYFKQLLMDEYDVRTDLISWSGVDVMRIPDELLAKDIFPAVQPVIRAEPIMFEFIASGILTGSNWSEYGKYGTINGVKYKWGLQEGDDIPNGPHFRATTKAPAGQHDVNVSFDKLCEKLGDDTADYLRDKTREIYGAMSKVYDGHGLVMPDTKLEFGYDNPGDSLHTIGNIVLIDEVGTPDSSRIWDDDGKMRSYDKDKVRAYVDEEIAKCEAVGKSVGELTLPDWLVDETSQTYDFMAEVITGETYAHYVERMEQLRQRILRERAQARELDYME